MWSNGKVLSYFLDPEVYVFINIDDTLVQVAPTSFLSPNKVKRLKNIGAAQFTVNGKDFLLAIRPGSTSFLEFVRKQLLANIVFYSKFDLEHVEKIKEFLDPEK